MNRLRGISDNGYVSLYWYDAGGNRTVKEHQGGEAVWVNGTAAGANTDSVSYSIYPNPYISISGDRWTKHYYIGAERIASRTGTISNFSALNSMQNLPAGDGIMYSVVYSTLRHAQEDSVASMYAQLGVPYQVRRTTTRGEGAHLYFPITRTGEDVDGDSSAGTSDDNPQRNHPSTLGDGQVYFYLRDHLGSTLSVTDSVGNYAQQVEYTPWGEVFVEQQGNSSNFSTPFLFNGKELDEETGLYYYGARYYDPKMSVWYSTDPMEEKYPWVSTYSYTMNNPVKFIDNDGKKVIPAYFKDDNKAIFYHSPKKFQNAMIAFAKTTFGKQILSDFTPKGSKIFGIEGNGKYADFDLYLYELEYNNVEKHTNEFYDSYRIITSQTQFRKDDMGKPKFHILFDLNYSEDELIESITHEFTVHLSRYEIILDSFKKDNKFSDARNQWLKHSQNKEHYDLAHGKKLESSKNYYKTINELIQKRPSLKQISKERIKEYE